MATKTRRKKSNVQRRLDEADRIIEEQVDAIDAQLEKVSRMLHPYEKLKERENKLRAARRALLGGSRLTGSGGNNAVLRMEDVVRYLKERPTGAVPSQIAQAHGVTQPVVSSHLYRGRQAGRYLSKNGRWYLRDPKSGINSEEDIEDDGE